MSAADFSYLDSEQLRGIYAVQNEHPAMVFHVQGVKCGRCVEKIESIQNDFSEIQDISFNLGDRRLRIQLDSWKSSFAKIVTAIEGKGFKLTPVESKNDLVALNKIEDKKDILRLGIAGACASNIMMFSFANYFGADQSLKVLFSWLSFALYLPILMYAALPFYRGFIDSIKSRSFSVDGPMTIASVGGFAFSAYNLILNRGSIYFDSISGFLFLILLSRFFQKRLQRKFLSFQGEMPIESLSRARKVADGVTSWVPSHQIQIGDRILVKQNEILPVDGVVLSESVLLSTAYLTGESHSLQRLSGSIVQAGSLLRSEKVLLQVSSLPSQTAFAKLIKQVLDQEISGKNSSIKNISDLWSQILLFTVTVLSIASIFYNWSVSPEMALERALAMFVLACPCAMAFGTPLALTFAMKNAFSRGFLVRSPAVFEKILSIKNIVFDKTGTLTGKNLRIAQVIPEDLSQDEIDIILSLENISQNIYADAFRQFYQKRFRRIVRVQDSQEEVGKGVSGFYQGNFYELKSMSHNLSEFKDVAFSVNGNVKAIFSFEESLDPSVHTMMNLFKERGFGLYILSGDKKKPVQEIAHELGVPDSHCFSAMSPLDKRHTIAKIPAAMMIGDGVNDALAFQAAQVGIAVQGSVEIALRSSDIYVLSPEIGHIPEIFSISENAIRLIKRNLYISVFYNVVGGTAALMGLVNPFVAALLMPMSSGFILLSTWWGSRR